MSEPGVADGGAVTDARRLPSDAPTPSPDGASPHRELAVAIEGVQKRFGGVQALRDLHLTVPEGQITVLLGPNGAGKTTAIRIITGALPPDAGRVRTLGLDPADDGEAVRLRCGVVSAKPALYDRLDGWDNLGYAAALYGIRVGATEQIRAAAARFGIDHALDQKVGGYSTGMKTRLALARAILHRPDLLLFDEPTSGLDPESSQAVLRMIREMTADGTTVIMCTHLLVEAEGLADQIVMLEDGAALLAGSQDELVRRYWPTPVVRFDAVDPTGLDALSTCDGVLGYERNGVVTVELDDLARVPDLVGWLTTNGVRLTRVEPHRPSLEELYFTVRRGVTAPEEVLR
ncbi:MAG: ABC transporter ATP-binding protein [Acidimicrobiales bacterium]|nr:ABC transporter ATP-binding protein [Acidimicrobiales bacterium]